MMTSKRGSPVVERLPLTEARVHLGEVIRRVHVNKARVILEKDGIPVAGLLAIDEFEDYLELQDPKVRELLPRPTYRVCPSSSSITRTKASSGWVPERMALMLVDSFPALTANRRGRVKASPARMPAPVTRVVMNRRCSRRSPPGCSPR